MTEPVELDPGSDAELDAIIAELDAEYTGVLPESALRRAQQRRSEITPRLIELIRRATESVRGGSHPPGPGHAYALFLLTEFKAKEALPAILEAITLPGEAPMELFGETVVEDLPRVLVTLGGDLEMLDELIADRAVHHYVRWSAMEVYLFLVRDGRITREAAVERLRKHLVTATANREVKAVSFLICELAGYAPAEARAEIEEAYRQNLVEEFLIDLDSLRDGIANGDSVFQRSLENCRPSEVQDTVEELRRWNSFEEDEPPDEDDSHFDDSPVDDSPLRLDEETYDRLASLEHTPSPTTVRRSGLRIGRNDPCPCGSGKKFKKCCGRTSTPPLA